MIHDLTKKAPLEQVYEAVEAQLHAMKDSTGKDVFQHIGMWNNALEEMEGEPEFSTPAVLIEISSVEWDTIDCDEEAALVILNLHVYNKPQTETRLSTFRLLHAAGKSLKEIKGIFINKPVRVSTTVTDVNDSFMRLMDSYHLYTMTGLLEEAT